MKRQWQPGDVAMVTGPRHFLFPFGDDTATALCRRDNDCWYAIGHGNGVGWTDREVKCVEPTSLVVINPEDREAVERLTPMRLRERLEALLRVSIDDQEWERIRDYYQADLHATLQPPKPDEPTGLGAVVEDSHGDVYVHVGTHDDDSTWTCSSDGRNYAWLAIPAVRVLSEGVRDV